MEGDLHVDLLEASPRQLEHVPEFQPYLQLVEGEHHTPEHWLVDKQVEELYMALRVDQVEEDIGRVVVADLVGMTGVLGLDRKVEVGRLGRWWRVSVGYAGFVSLESDSDVY